MILIGFFLAPPPYNDKIPLKTEGIMQTPVTIIHSVKKGSKVPFLISDKKLRIFYLTP